MSPLSEIEKEFLGMTSGFSVVITTLLSAIAGTWIYGMPREKLLHQHIYFL